MALVAVVSAPVPNSRAVRMVNLVGVFARTSVVDVNINFRRLALKQALFFECPTNDLRVGPAAVFVTRPVLRVGGEKLSQPIRSMSRVGFGCQCLDRAQDQAGGELGCKVANVCIAWMSSAD